MLACLKTKPEEGAMDALVSLAQFFDDHPHYRTRGFLPKEDPLTAFPPKYHFWQLDDIGNRLPELLLDSGFRAYMRETYWPAPFAACCALPEDLPALRLYYVRVSFAASAYAHQIGQPAAKILPSNIAVPLARATHLLDRRPILSYDGYALYNWRKIDPEGPMMPDNLDTIQNFMRIPDAAGVNQERWFIAIHVAIEAAAAPIIDMLARYARGEADFGCVLYRMAEAMRNMTAILARIPEHMDPTVYHKTFREYIQSFENVLYQGIAAEGPLNLVGETGAQSSIFPLLDSFLGVHHDKRTKATRKFDGMRAYMPAEHRKLLSLIDALQIDFAKQPRTVQLARNEVIDAMYAFNARHLGKADRYIYQRTDRTTGTGGTPRGWLAEMAADRLASRL